MDTSVYCQHNRPNEWSGMFTTIHPQVTNCVMELWSENKGEKRVNLWEQVNPKIKFSVHHHREIQEKHTKKKSNVRVLNKAQRFHFQMCPHHWVPQTLISNFPQAISKTASCPTSLTLFFFKSKYVQIYFQYNKIKLSILSILMQSSF